MMFAFPLVPRPFIGVVFYCHYKRAWLSDMERDVSQRMLLGQSDDDESLIRYNPVFQNSTF